MMLLRHRGNSKSATWRARFPCKSHSGERISFGANKIEGEKRLLQEKMRYRHLLTRAQVREMHCRFRCVACFRRPKGHASGSSAIGALFQAVCPRP